MPVNAHPEYVAAEKRYSLSKTDEERLAALEEMVRTMPKHKSAEALRRNIRTRYKKLKEKLEGKKKKQKAARSKKGIRKEEMQAVLVGLTNSGKSSLLSSLTNAQPKISPIPFTTKEITIGMMDYEKVKIQLIDMPSINLKEFDRGIANDTDLLLIIITRPEELGKILPFLKKSHGKKLVILNKIDLLNKKQISKFSNELSKYDPLFISIKNKQNINELKKKIFLSFNKVRIYTKQNNQISKEPVVLDEGSIIKDVAEKIRKNSPSNIKEARITGPSAKFPNQKVSLEHKVKDGDMVEFKFV